MAVTVFVKQDGETVAISQDISWDAVKDRNSGKSGVVGKIKPQKVLAPLDSERSVDLILTGDLAERYLLGAHFLTVNDDQQLSEGEWYYFAADEVSKPQPVKQVTFWQHVKEAFGII